MGKKVLGILLVVLLSISIMFSGCKDKKVSTEKEENINNEQNINNEKNDKNTFDEIKSLLEKDEKVTEIKWSDDKSKVAFTKDIGDYNLQLYIWAVGDEKEREVDYVRGNIYDIKWSQNKFLSVNVGTSSVYETIIISVIDFKIIGSVINVGGPVWSPDGKKIAFAVLNDKKPIVDIEGMSTSDIMIYDIETKISEVILNAENDFFYNPLEWNLNGFKYEKNYLDDRQPEEYNLDKFQLKNIKYIGWWYSTTSKYNTELEILSFKDNFIEGNIYTVSENGKHIADAKFKAKIIDNKADVKFIDSFNNELEGTLIFNDNEISLDLSLVKQGIGWSIEEGNHIFKKTK